MSEQPEKLQIAFLDVGQGDTIVISDPDTHEAIVVDCTNATAVLDYLAQERIKYLRGILISHLHADHYSEVDNLLSRYNLVPGLEECGRVGFSQITDRAKQDILIQDEDEHSLYYERVHKKVNWSRKRSIINIKRWCEKDKTRFINPQVVIKPAPLPFEGELAKNTLLIHPYTLDIPDLQAKGLNNVSAIVRVASAGSSALLTGDLEPAGWRELRKLFTPTDLQSDVLKFPHHGGAWKNEDLEDLLDVVKPSIVVISVGSKGYEKYSHPQPDVFEALKKRPNIRLLCTQATNQCQAHVMTQRKYINTLLVEQATKNGQKLIGSKRGCPCAGTIVVELGEKAKVLQPETTFHQQSIISPHFKNHQCRFNPTVVAPTEAISKGSTRIRSDFD